MRGAGDRGALLLRLPDHDRGRPHTLLCFRQTRMQNVHSEMYSRLIETYVKDTKEQFARGHGDRRSPLPGRCCSTRSSTVCCCWMPIRMLSVAVPAIKRKAEWAMKWTNDKAVRMMRFPCLSVHNRPGVVCGAHCCVRVCGGDFLLRLVCIHLLAQAARCYAGPDLLQRAHQPRRGTALCDGGACH